MSEYLELVNPGELFLLENPDEPRRRKRKPTEMQSSTFTWVLLAAGAFTLIWYLVKKEWWWRSVGRPKLRQYIPTPPPRNTHQEPVNLIMP